MIVNITNNINFVDNISIRTPKKGLFFTNSYNCISIITHSFEDLKEPHIKSIKLNILNDVQALHGSMITL